MPETLTKTTSFAEYPLLPYDGKRTELVDEEIVYMAEASPLHADIIDLLLMLLKSYVAESEQDLIVRASTIGVEIPRVEQQSNVRDPDLIVCDRTQWKGMRHLTKDVFSANKPPVLAVEVTRTGNTKRDVREKREEYALAKVPEYWIVNPVDDYVLTLKLEGSSYKEIGEFRGDAEIKSVLFPDIKVTAATLLDPQ